MRLWLKILMAMVEENGDRILLKVQMFLGDGHNVA